MSPYALFHLLTVAPALLLGALWAVGAARSRTRLRLWLMLGAGGWLLHYGLELTQVLAGSPAWEALWLRGQWRWTVLTGLLWLTGRPRDTPRIDPTSVVFALLYFASEAWGPAILVLGRGLTGMSTAKRLLLLAHLGILALQDHAFLAVADRLGFLGLGMDGTTIAAVWLLGALELGSWAALLWGLEKR